VSIDGLTIMINVNRKKKKPPFSSQQCAQARNGLAAALLWVPRLGELRGSSLGGGGGQGHRPGSSCTSSPLARSLLVTLDFSDQDAGFGGHQQTQHALHVLHRHGAEAGQVPTHEWASKHWQWHWSSQFTTVLKPPRVLQRK